LILLDAPRPSPYDWFDIQRIAQLRLTNANGESISAWGRTTMISEVGAVVELTKSNVLPVGYETTSTVELELVDEQLALAGTITQTQMESDLPTLTIEFAAMTLPQQRQLVQLLFCRPGQWQSRCSPNEVQSLWLIVKSVFRPRFLTKPRLQPKPVIVSRG
ncbi:MAG: cellulose synthase catalytic subunit, partial [Leptolyngbyaceae cyanobacterium]